MRKLVIWMVLLTTGLSSHVHGGRIYFDPDYPGPCNDAGIAYEQSIDRARLCGVILAGVVVTGLITWALFNTRCKHKHCH